MYSHQEVKRFNITAMFGELFLVEEGCYSKGWMEFLIMHNLQVWRHHWIFIISPNHCLVNYYADPQVSWDIRPEQGILRKLIPTLFNISIQKAKWVWYCSRCQNDAFFFASILQHQAFFSSTSKANSWASWTQLQNHSSWAVGIPAWSIILWYQVAREYSMQLLLIMFDQLIELVSQVIYLSILMLIKPWNVPFRRMKACSIAGSMGKLLWHRSN